ncbi:MAG: nucleotide exchange factor GrpE [Chloroflexi bacterium]|nr:nucleotide exchange factor GrpE [Chloroflexota bacterium]
MIQQQPEERDNGPDLGIARIEISELRKALAEEKEKAEKYLTSWQRTQADFANYKRRAEQDKEEYIKFASSGLILSILPFLDDLERALDSVPPDLAEASWVNGVRLIERKFLSALEGQGVSIIRSLGEPFDPRFHEAIRQAPGKEGVVLEEIQRGYKLQDRVLRPSLVVVGNGETESE